MINTDYRLAVVVAGLLLGATSPLPASAGPPAAADAPVALHQLLWPQPQALPPFQLTDQHQHPFGLDRLRDRWTFMFFGYTYCPDVCPNTLAILKGVAARLTAEAPVSPAAQFVFASVDPQRDTLGQLGQYLGYFSPDFIGITGIPDQIAALTRALQVSYERVETDVPGAYQINHSASILLIDPQARLYAAFTPPHEAAGIAAQFRHLQRHYEEHHETHR